MSPAEDSFQEALATGIKLLSKRDRSEHELRSALTVAGVAEGVIDEVVRRLQSKKILDDARFAESLVRRRVQKGVGLERIRQELSLLGVGEAVIETVVSSLSGDQPELAVEALRKLLARSPALNRAGAYRFLAGKGFSESDVERAVDTLLGAADPFAE